MRRRGGDVPPGRDGRADWHDELRGEVLGLMIGLSRLMAHVQEGPPSDPDGPGSLTGRAAPRVRRR